MVKTPPIELPGEVPGAKELGESPLKKVSGTSPTWVNLQNALPIPSFALPHPTQSSESRPANCLLHFPFLLTMISRRGAQLVMFSACLWTRRTPFQILFSVHPLIGSCVKLCLDPASWETRMERASMSVPVHSCAVSPHSMLYLSGWMFSISLILSCFFCHCHVFWERPTP